MGGLPKRGGGGGLGKFADLRGGACQERWRVVCFGWRVDTPLHTMSKSFLVFDLNSVLIPMYDLNHAS